MKLLQMKMTRWALTLFFLSFSGYNQGLRVSSEYPFKCICLSSFFYFLCILRVRIGSQGAFRMESQGVFRMESQGAFRMVSQGIFRMFLSVGLNWGDSSFNSSGW